MAITTTDSGSPHAFAFLHFGNSSNYRSMVILAARTIRRFHSEDLLCIVGDQSDGFLRPLVEEGIRVVRRPEIDCPALGQYRGRAAPLSRFDIQKIHYWSLAPYRRIFALDCDTLLKRRFDLWQRPQLQYHVGTNAPLNSGQLLLSPADETYREMLAILHDATFSATSGWNGCGPLDAPRFKSWDFQAANAAQGFLVYYFAKIKPALHPANFSDFTTHFAGVQKYRDPYVRWLREAGLPFDVPARHQRTDPASS